MDRNFVFCEGVSLLRVALRKESVDRNKHTQPAEQVKARRSPQGERG